MNRNERIKAAATTIRDKINQMKQWREIDFNGFKTQADFALLGPREIDQIRESIYKIIDEVTQVKK